MKYLVISNVSTVSKSSTEPCLWIVLDIHMCFMYKQHKAQSVKFPDISNVCVVSKKQHRTQSVHFPGIACVYVVS